MKNRILSGLKTAWRYLRDWIIAILTYLFLVLDRLFLVPFIFVSSYSAKELAERPSRFTSYSIMRVAVLLFSFLAYFIISLIV